MAQPKLLASRFPTACGSSIVENEGVEEKCECLIERETVRCLGIGEFLVFANMVHKDHKSSG